MKHKVYESLNDGCVRVENNKKIVAGSCVVDVNVFVAYRYYYWNEQGNIWAKVVAYRSGILPRLY
jgi:hypothetical protein